MPAAVYWRNLSFRDKFFGYRPTDDLVWVCELEVRDLEDAFRQCNRIDDPVPLLDDAEAPSMSVGDVVEIRDQGWFACASVGFSPIPAPSPEHLIRAEKAGDVISARFEERRREQELGASDQ